VEFERSLMDILGPAGNPQVAGFQLLCRPEANWVCHHWLPAWHSRKPVSQVLSVEGPEKHLSNARIINSQ
jgi:hypothetical protein